MICPSDIDLMQPFPREKNQYLFHYTSYASALGILLSQQMRMGSLKNMNDPLEFQDHRKDSIVFCDNPTNEEIALRMRRFNDAVIEREKAVRFSSFSMDLSKGSQGEYYNNLSKGWARSRMWAQYADNHKGVCLVFDKKKLVEDFENSFKSDLCETHCGKVDYTNNLDSLKETLSKLCDSFLTLDKIQFLFLKCEDFKDEQEFRLLLINKRLKDENESVSFSIAKSICGVIPGTKFSKENELSLRKAIESCNPSIRWLPIWWDYGMPRLSDYVCFKKKIDETGISEG